MVSMRGHSRAGTSLAHNRSSALLAGGDELAGHRFGSSGGVKIALSRGGDRSFTKMCHE